MKRQDPEWWEAVRCTTNHSTPISLASDTLPSAHHRAPPAGVDDEARLEFVGHARFGALDRELPRTLARTSVRGAGVNPFHPEGGRALTQACIEMVPKDVPTASFRIAERIPVAPIFVSPSGDVGHAGLEFGGPQQGAWTVHAQATEQPDDCPRERFAHLQRSFVDVIQEPNPEPRKTSNDRRSGPGRARSDNQQIVHGSFPQ